MLWSARSSPSVFFAGWLRVEVVSHKRKVVRPTGFVLAAGCMTNESVVVGGGSRGHLRLDLVARVFLLGSIEPEKETDAFHP
jgi:hypothetical protein